MSAVARVAHPEQHVLGEGAFWDPVRGLVLWIDIQRGLVLAGRLSPEGDLEIVERVAVDRTVGAVAPAADGSWVVAGAEGLLVRSPGGRLEPWTRIVPAGSGRRLNDGSPDPAGRYLIGTMALAGGSEVEELLVVERDGATRLLDADLTLSNGLGFTADGSVLYSADTGRDTVFRRPYDPATGETGPREPFVVLDEGHPDGLCLDAEDHVWIAVWGGAAVVRVDPQGRIVARHEIPAPHVTSVAFAGPALDTLVVTTASEQLSAEQLARFPDSGRVFTLRPGVTGQPPLLWGGRSG